MSGYWTNGFGVVPGNYLSGDSYIPVDTGLPNGSSPQSGKMIPGTLPAASGFTAAADGLKADATPLDYGISAIETVAGAADSVLLPTGYAGATCVVINTIATAIQVFGSGSDTISGAATGTGVSQAASKTAIYHCYEVESGVGKWWQMVGG